MRAFDPITIDRTGRLLPRDTYEVCPRPSLTRYDMPGIWEPVQRSAQRIYPSVDDYSASRLHRAFSGLQFHDFLDDDDGYLGYDDHISCRNEVPERRIYRPESCARTTNGKFSKPVRRVVHDSRDRMIQIPVEHVITIPDDQDNRDTRRSAPLDIRENGIRKNSYDFIDLSDEGDELPDSSFSDHSDCEIYPFTMRNLNNNGPNVRTRRSRSNKRSEPYSVDLRMSSSPETDCTFVSPLPSPGRSTLCRSQNQNIPPVSGSEKRRKEEDKLLGAPPYTRLYDNDLYRKSESDILYRNEKPSLSFPSRSSRYKPEDKYALIEDDKDSAFSVNHGYKFSDDENGIMDRDLKFDESTKAKNQTKEEGSRHSSDSDEGITATPSYPAYNIIRDMIEPEGRQVDYIKGDGNCFFRALSKVIYNTESCHEEIRQAVVDLMEKYPKDFEQFIDGKSIHYHIKAMRRPGTWGTQAEIYGAATLLQRDIYILSPDHSGKCYRWLLFSPRFKQTDVNCFDLCYITLCHTNGNHYDRIAPLVGKCNCALLPPQLSGVKDKVDLTNDSEEDLLIV